MLNWWSATRPSNTSARRAYLRRCARISLTRRWGQPVLGAALAAVAGAALGWPLLLSAALALLGAGLVSAVIMLDSCRRHADDLP